MDHLEYMLRYFMDVSKLHLSESLVPGVEMYVHSREQPLHQNTNTEARHL